MALPRLRSRKFTAFGERRGGHVALAPQPGAAVPKSRQRVAGPQRPRGREIVLAAARFDPGQRIGMAECVARGGARLDRARVRRISHEACGAVAEGSPAEQASCRVAPGQAPAAQCQSGGSAGHHALAVHEDGPASGAAHGAAQVRRAAPWQTGGWHQAVAREHGTEAALTTGDRHPRRAIRPARC